ncbi:MAG: WYL domain-containing protein [Actinomycetaceae bacterium]|nr:WYL domain-containing protein [Actinomycetaceae bacterium]
MANLTDRLERTLAILEWVDERGSATVDEVASHFGLTRAQVEAIIGDLDLTYYGSDCYDTQVQLEWHRYFEEDVIALTVGNQDIYQTSDLTLTQRRAALIALWLYTRLVPAVPVQLLLSTSAKLAPLEGFENLESSLVWVEADSQEAANRLLCLKALNQGMNIGFEYTDIKGKETSREVQPRQVQYLDGHWLVQGYCFEAEADRNFRCDRMRELRLTPNSRTRADLQSSPSSGREVRLEVDRQWMWALTLMRRAGRKDATFTVEVHDRVWGENQLLKLGEGLRECSDRTLLDGAAARARQALDSYRWVEGAINTVD